MADRAIFDPPPGIVLGETDYSIPGRWCSGNNVRFVDGTLTLTPEGSSGSLTVRDLDGLGLPGALDADLTVQTQDATMTIAGDAAIDGVGTASASLAVELPRRPRDYVPLGRLGRLEDVCDAVEFLAGEKAAYVTGVNLDVAGGYLLSPRELPGPA